MLSNIGDIPEWDAHLEALQLSWRFGEGRWLQDTQATLGDSCDNTGFFSGMSPLGGLKKILGNMDLHRILFQMGWDLGKDWSCEEQVFWCTRPLLIKQKGWRPSSVPRMQPLATWLSSATNCVSAPGKDEILHQVDRFGSHWIFFKARTMMAKRDLSWLGEVLKRFWVWSPCLP